uniref:Geranylgeranyl diphosphate synthase n=1 Tax=Prunella vulgaris TaxID=39358 RepID=A0A6B7LF43_PRUVU|nr:geranylgeranyl diphosphate synthase [Prunella vulgaris]
MAFSIAATLTPSPNAYYKPKAGAPVVLRRAVRCSSATAAAAVSSEFDLRSYWTSLIKEVDEKLNDAVPMKYPELIHEAMRYSLLAKTAKRAPPVMCIAAYELFGGHRDAAFPTACALEMVHAASLVHDDLPYLDDAPTRRGQPSSHTVYGPDMAILAGDALFPLAFQHIVLNTPPQLVPQSNILRVVQEIARAVGSTGMAAGQLLEIEDDPSTVEFVHEKKFGELGQCSAVCGGLLGGASDDEIERLREYGKIVGILYRVVEDIFEANTNVKRGKSYVSVYGIEKAIKAAEHLQARAKKELNVFEKYGDGVLPLYSFIDYAAERL